MYSGAIAVGSRWTWNGHVCVVLEVREADSVLHREADIILEWDDFAKPIPEALSQFLLCAIPLFKPVPVVF